MSTKQPYHTVHNACKQNPMDSIWPFTQTSRGSFLSEDAQSQTDNSGLWIHYNVEDRGEVSSFWFPPLIASGDWKTTGNGRHGQWVLRRLVELLQHHGDRDRTGRSYQYTAFVLDSTYSIWSVHWLMDPSCGFRWSFARAFRQIWCLLNFPMKCKEPKK